MGIKYKVVAPAGKYTDSSGAEKTRYVDVGVIIETRTGLMLKAEAIPVGWDGTAFLNDPKPAGEHGGGAGGSRGGAPRRERPAPVTERTGSGEDDFIDDEIPFIRWGRF